MYKILPLIFPQNGPKWAKFIICGMEKTTIFGDLRTRLRFLAYPVALKGKKQEERTPRRNGKMSGAVVDFCYFTMTLVWGPMTRTPSLKLAVLSPIKSHSWLKPSREMVISSVELLCSSPMTLSP